MPTSVGKNPPAPVREGGEPEEAALDLDRINGRIGPGEAVVVRTVVAVAEGRAGRVDAPGFVNVPSRNRCRN